MKIDTYYKSEKAVQFCENFIKNPDNKPRYIFGRNEYAESIASFVNVDGFVDDFTEEESYLDKPIIKAESIPSDSLVVVVVLGRPLTAKNRLDNFGIANLDYFSFYKYSGLNIMPVTFWNEFQEDYLKNTNKYNRVYDLLVDEDSKLIFSRLINFRLSGDLKYMEGFSDIQYRQYFEDFLCLKPEGEIFVDVGGYDGNTTIEFINRYPGFEAIHFFEPDATNMSMAKERLESYSNVHFHQVGLSNKTQTLRFQSYGSSSKVSKDGNVEVTVDTLDNIVSQPFTFIKLDIEGAEGEALEGGKNSIRKYHPKIAVCAYHKGDDLRRIPEQILSYRSDYNLFLRHYTEGVVETVMFFVPK